MAMPGLYDSRNEKHIKKAMRKVDVLVFVVESLPPKSPGEPLVLQLMT